jgi:hypothetical protein
MSQPAPSPTGGPPRETHGSAPTSSDVDDLQQRIRRTREDLGQTVAALTSKTQVRARARDKAAEVADRAWHCAPVTRIREYDPVGRVRSYDPVGRVRGTDVTGRIRGMDLTGRARTNRTPVIVLVAAATGLTTAAVLTRRRRQPARTRRNRLRARR